MARVAWLFLLVLLCVAIWLGWQAYTRPPIALAPVTIELKQESFVNPYLPTGEPVEGIVTGIGVEHSQDHTAAEPHSNTIVSSDFLPNGAVGEVIVAGDVPDHSQRGYFPSSNSTEGQGALVCVFDPVGNNGDVYSLMKDFQANAGGWGAEIELKAYTDEGIIVDEFKASKCDGAVLTGLKSRDFNRFASTIEAVGATTDNDVLRSALETLMNMKPKAAQKYLRNGPYEVAGIMPAGAIYAYLRDRNWDSLDKIQGKKITVMEGDSVSQSMVRQAGGTPVVATTTSFAGKFNNGSVDITFAPAAAYEPLEMYRGLGDKGGVVDLVFSRLTFQLLIRHEKFPADFGANARRTSLESFDGAFEFIDRATKTIDPKYWVKLDPKDIPGYAAMMRQSRIALRDKGVYDGKMLKILRKIRCKKKPTAVECAENLE